jgi:hypothetical protein
MPTTSKPRKPYRQRRANRPMTATVHRRLALEIRLAVETLVGAPSPDSYNTLSKMLAALAGAGMKCEALTRATDTMNMVLDRYERIGKIGLSGDEIRALRESIAVLDGRMALIPVNRIAEAVAQVEVFCAIGA